MSFTIELSDEGAARVNDLAATFQRTPQQIVEAAFSQGLANFQPDGMMMLAGMAAAVRQKVPENEKVVPQEQQ